MWITDSVQLELYTSNFGGTKLHLRVREEKKVECHWPKSVGASMCQNPMGLHSLLQEQLYLYLLHFNFYTF
jgi:hypothetical protein